MWFFIEKFTVGGCIKNRVPIKMSMTKLWSVMIRAFRMRFLRKSWLIVPIFSLVGTAKYERRIEVSITYFILLCYKNKLQEKYMMGANYYSLL